MAGNGPAPEAKEQRRRRNKPARGEWVDLEPLEAPVLPELPVCPFFNEAGDRLHWSERAKAAWGAWRDDPVTAYYTPADIQYAIDLLCLYEGMTPSNANEVRLRMDGLGLTPKGKKDLRYRVADDAGGESGGSRRRRTRSAGSDRRARLSVVK
ncbi:MAG TPA: hypothetical protein VGD39_15350 [Nocardioides sp.]